MARSRLLPSFLTVERQYRWRHPTETELYRFQLEDPDPSRDGTHQAIATHLASCESCERHATRLRTFLNELRDEGRQDAEASIGPDRLDTQHARVMRRIRRSVAPRRAAHVLRFPTPFSRPVLRPAQHVTRWLGAAAVAGLVVGVTIGQYLHVHPVSSASGDTTVTPVEGLDAMNHLETAPSVVQVPPGLDLLDEIDQVLTGSQVPELTPLDTLTPRIREISDTPW